MKTSTWSCIFNDSTFLLYLHWVFSCWTKRGTISWSVAYLHTESDEPIRIEALHLCSCLWSFYSRGVLHLLLGCSHGAFSCILGKRGLDTEGFFSPSSAKICRCLPPWAAQGLDFPTMLSFCLCRELILSRQTQKFSSYGHSSKFLSPSS